MNVSFPTRPTIQAGGNYQPGLPDRASPCRCLEGPCLDQPTETCIRCGHYDSQTISQTWIDRVHRITRPVLKAAA